MIWANVTLLLESVPDLHLAIHMQKFPRRVETVSFVTLYLYCSLFDGNIYTGVRNPVTLVLVPNGTQLCDIRDEVQIR